LKDAIVYVLLGFVSLCYNTLMHIRFLIQKFALVSLAGDAAA